MIRRQGTRSVIITVGLLVGLLGARLGSGMVLAQEHSADPAVVATMAESAALPAQQVAENLTFTILIDPRQVTDRAYRVTGIPRTLIIDREGKVHADFTGLHPERTLRAKLSELGIK